MAPKMLTYSGKSCMNGFEVSVHKIQSRLKFYLILSKKKLQQIEDNPWKKFYTPGHPTANSSGSTLYYSDPYNAAMQLVQDRRYEKSAQWNFLTILSTILLGIPLFWITSRNTGSIFLPLFFVFVFIVQWIFSINRISYLVHYPQKLKRWHGCEHKLIYLYKKKLPRTYENFLKARKEAASCGAGNVAIELLVAVKFYTAFITVVLWGFLPAILIFFGIHMLMQVPVTLLLQKLWATAEPDEQQIQHALEVAHTIDEELRLAGLYEKTIKQTRQ